MTAATHDIKIEQGATWRLSIVYGRKTGDLDVDGNPIVEPYDITNCTLRMQIRARRDSAILASCTTENGGIIITDAVGGKIQMTLRNSQTDLLNMRRAKHDLELRWPSGDVVRILEGKVTISPTITRPLEPGDDLPIDNEDEFYQPSAATTVSVSADVVSPQVVGTPITLTATVDPAVAGSVEFFEGNTSIGTATALPNGMDHTLTVSTLTPGFHRIRAVFDPTDEFAYSPSISLNLPYTITAT